MSADRYVVLGVAHIRSPWFTDVARWAALGSLPVEFVKCLSVGELVGEVDSGRPASAALVDGRLGGVDRDLLDHLARRDIPSVVVAADGTTRPWTDLGASAVLAPSFAAADLARTLTEVARPIVEVITTRVEAHAPPPPAVALAPVVAVLGRSGSGSSTIAAALAQDLAGPAGAGASATTGGVVLADLALHAQQAVLHDAGDVVPGLPELVEAHRGGTLDHDQVLALTFGVPQRGYRLLLGLRRHRDWTTIGARSLRAGLDGLRGAAGTVVIDTDADLEGEAETGSFDVEDRNVLARTAVRSADVVVAVGRPTAAGLHGLVILLDDLRRAEVPAERVLVVLNGAPRRPRARADLARTLQALSTAIAGATGATATAEPGAVAFVGHRRSLDDVHLAVARFPASVGGPVRAGVHAVLARAGRRPSAPAADRCVPVRPGELSRP